MTRRTDSGCNVLLSIGFCRGGGGGRLEEGDSLGRWRGNFSVVSCLDPQTPCFSPPPLRFLGRQEKRAGFPPGVSFHLPAGSRNPDVSNSSLVFLIVRLCFFVLMSCLFFFFYVAAHPSFFVLQLLVFCGVRVCGASALVELAW